MYKRGTLKTRRYRNFLPPFVGKNNFKIDIIIKHFTFKFQFSRAFWECFSKMYLFFFNIKLLIKQIFQIPINLVFWLFLNNFRKKGYKHKKKIKSWLYKQYRARKTFWMETKKNILKDFFKQIFTFKKIKNYIQYDYLTNYFCVLKKSKLYEKINEFFYNNKMMKMLNFRFK